jgi:hypothetical protein
MIQDDEQNLYSSQSDNPLYIGIRSPESTDPVVDPTADLFSVGFYAISVGIYFSKFLYNQFSTILTYRYQLIQQNQPYTSQDSFLWPPNGTLAASTVESPQYLQPSTWVSI